jgi:hypothetical protein
MQNYFFGLQNFTNEACKISFWDCKILFWEGKIFHPF